MSTTFSRLNFNYLHAQCSLKPFPKKLFSKHLHHHLTPSPTPQNQNPSKWIRPPNNPIQLLYAPFNRIPKSESRDPSSTMFPVNFPPMQQHSSPEFLMILAFWLTPRRPAPNPFATNRAGKRAGPDFNSPLVCIPPPPLMRRGIDRMTELLILLLSLPLLSLDEGTT